MITFLEGLLAEKSPARAVLNVGGVGYEVFVPLSSYERLGAPGESCRLLVFDYVREDQHSLFGFVSASERRMFGLLMGVSGIGPKLAMTVLSGLTVRELNAAIAAGDVKRLSGITGVGKKTAERIVLELRDKLARADALEAGGSAAAVGDLRLRDAVLALVSLGYKQAEARKKAAAVLASASAEIAVEDIVRKALTGQ